MFEFWVNERGCSWEHCLSQGGSVRRMIVGVVGFPAYLESCRWFSK
jgi:hypothetical protein